MSEAISDPRYWRKRLREAGQLHHAIFRCPLDKWQRIEAKHKEILKEHIQPGDSILDAGCGWGRLLTLLPGEWRGGYWGIDLSPDFVAMAQEQHKRIFTVADLRTLPTVTEFVNGHILTGDDYGEPFDWAILISIRPMIKRHLGDEEWAKIEANLRRVAKRLLYLEYDENDPGSIE